MTNSAMKYITRIGECTGKFRQSKKVHTMAKRVDFTTECQNSNSGNFLTNGLRLLLLNEKSGPSVSENVNKLFIVLSSKFRNKNFIFYHQKPLMVEETPRIN